jgi:hypothetical protein
MSFKSETHTVSMWRLWSEGVVAENKPLSTNDCFVTPYEVFPMMDGELGDDEEELETEGVDSFDVPFKLKVKVSSTIRCKWYPRGSNRATAPDVRKGERVEIWRFGDSPEYYWVPKGLDDHLRRLETVRFLFNADPDGLGDNPPSPENCYVIEISTHEKKITIQTSKINEEPFAYTIQLNTGEGYLTIMDDADNYLMLDSAEKHIRFQNGDGAFFELLKRNINVHAPDDINVEALRDILIECKNLTWQAKNNVTFKVGQTFTAEATTFKFKGKFKHEGDFEVDGKSEFKDEMKANGIKSPTKPIQGPSNTI